MLLRRAKVRVWPNRQHPRRWVMLDDLATRRVRQLQLAECARRMVMLNFLTSYVCWCLLDNCATAGTMGRSWVDGLFALCWPSLGVQEQHAPEHKRDVIQHHPEEDPIQDVIVVPPSGDSVATAASTGGGRSSSPGWGT